MNSEQIQEALLTFLAKNHGKFTAPYGILIGDGKSAKGFPYRSLTFGIARTLDATINIYNRSFILYRSNRGEHTFKSFDEVMEFLKKEFDIL